MKGQTQRYQQVLHEKTQLLRLALQCSTYICNQLLLGSDQRHEIAYAVNRFEGAQCILLAIDIIERSDGEHCIAPAYQGAILRPIAV